MSSAGNATAQETNQLEVASEVPQMIGAFVACLIIAYSGVLLRLISRRLKRTDLKADDWLIISSLVRSELPIEYRTDGILG